MYSFAGYYLLLVVIAIRLSGSKRSYVAKSMIMLVPAILLNLPVDGHSIFYFLRGALGDFSITTTLLLATTVVGLFSKEICSDMNILDQLYPVLFITGLVFYVSSLGATHTDIYSTGFQPTAIQIIFVMIALFCLANNYYLPGLLFTLPVIAYYGGILESDNFWDYVLDPLVWLYATGATFKKFLLLIERNEIA